MIKDFLCELRVKNEKFKVSFAYTFKANNFKVLGPICKLRGEILMP